MAVGRSENTGRNIVFFGETGAGKSAVINLLLEAGVSAPVSNDTEPCTQTSTSYETTLNGTKYTLWDTRGLGEGRKFLKFFNFGARSEEGFKKFLAEMSQGHGVDLLVFCIRGPRATAASVRYYNNVCSQLVTPVVVVVTHLEKEPVDMENWWHRNSSHLKKCNLEFSDHVCITTLPAHSRRAESKNKLVDLITKEHRWEGKDTKPFRGTPIQTSTYSAPPPPYKGGVLRSLFKAKYTSEVDGRSLGKTLPAGPSSPAPSTGYYTPAESPGETMPPSPIVEPPTPSSATIHAKVPPIDTKLLVVGGPSQPSSGETYASSYSMCTGYATVMKLELTDLRNTWSPYSSNTSHSQVDLQSHAEESKDSLLDGLHLTATVIRKKGYATRHGFFGDIWECDLISGESTRPVAVKAVKTGTDDDKDLRSHEKKLRRELKVWGRLQHGNIVPLLGTVSDFGPLPSMVSPWFLNGSLSSYIARRQLSRMEKHMLLKDIAAGLCYLHSHGVIHGDLHGENVLIDDNGKACLTDFGLSFLNEFVGTPYLRSSICGAIQFADPALVQRVNDAHGRVVYPTKPCDVYSFGGLMLHALSGKQPYDDLAPGTMCVKISQGKRPKIPTNDIYIDPWHKSLIRRCWEHDESKRPSAIDLEKTFGSDAHTR